jgi:hypothetical protein
MAAEDRAEPLANPARVAEGGVMRTLRLWLAGMISLSLLVGVVGGVVAQSDEARESAFPTGTFVADEDGLTLEFRADGTCQRSGVPCTFGVSGDLYSEMTFEDASGPQVPATYYWDFDGENLSFDLTGEDPRPSRYESYANHTYRAVGETLPLPATETDFPTGMFVAEEKPTWGLQFNADGTGWAFAPGYLDTAITYGVNGDLWTEMTFTYPGSERRGSQTPVTYYWDWDGEHLTFELWGEDLRPGREANYTGNTYRLMEDPREVLVARRDLPAGSTVVADLRLVPKAEAAGALRHPNDLFGQVAAVDIPAGTPITRDLLEPAE